MVVVVPDYLSNIFAKRLVDTQETRQGIIKIWQQAAGLACAN